MLFMDSFLANDHALSCVLVNLVSFMFLNCVFMQIDYPWLAGLVFFPPPSTVLISPTLPMCKPASLQSDYLKDLSHDGSTYVY